MSFSRSTSLKKFNQFGFIVRQLREYMSVSLGAPFDEAQLHRELVRSV